MLEKPETVTRTRAVRLAAAALLLIAASAGSVAAQDEAALKSYFEGRRVTLRMDMPGSQDGVDLQVDRPPSLDYKKYRNDLKRYGVALASGDASTITLIKVKHDLIEFQIGGGGYGTFGDDTSTSSNIKLLDKTEREKTLEKRIKDEKDKDRKRSLQRELDDLRDRREAENRILRAESERIEAEKRARIADRRLRGGSRFNLKWEKHVPASITPDDVVHALVEYVDFRNERVELPPPADISLVRKGMLRAEAERVFGEPIDRSEKREGNVVVTTLVFDVGEQRLSAAFVEDVLVRYTITSK